MSKCPTPEKRKYGDRVSALARLEQHAEKERKGTRSRFRPVPGKELNVYRCVCGFWHVGHSVPKEKYVVALKQLEEIMFKRNELREKFEQAKDRLRRRWAQRMGDLIEAEVEAQTRIDAFEAEQAENLMLARRLAERDLSRSRAARSDDAKERSLTCQ